MSANRSARRRLVTGAPIEPDLATNLVDIVLNASSPKTAHSTEVSVR